MSDEVVTLQDKFTKWNVYRRKGKKLTESVETSPYRMTPQEALKYFKASAIIAIIS